MLLESDRGILKMAHGAGASGAVSVFVLALRYWVIATCRRLLGMIGYSGDLPIVQVK